MSEVLKAHFLVENNIDITKADRKYNWFFPKDDSPESITAIGALYGNAFPTSDNFISSNVVHYGDVYLKDTVKIAAYWYSITNAGFLFARPKYACYDAETMYYISRTGERLINPGPAGELATQDYLNELDAVDSPPEEELDFLFSYILSLNSHFYFLFSLEPMEYELSSGTDFMTTYSEILTGRELVVYDSKSLQKLLIKQFNEYSKNEPFNLYLGNKLFHKSLKRLIFKVT